MGEGMVAASEFTPLVAVCGGCSVVVVVMVAKAQDEFQRVWEELMEVQS